MIPEWTKRGDYRLLDEAAQNEATNLFEVSSFGFCFAVPEDGWASPTQHLEQDQDPRRPEAPVLKRARPPL